MRKAYISCVFLILAGIFLAGVLSGCGSFKIPAASEEIKTAPTSTPYKPGGGDNIFSINYSPEYGINPLNGLNKGNRLVSSLVYESLFVLDKDYNYRSVLCDSWTTDRGKSFRFVIKQGITFHDGTPLTAYDIAFSLNQAKKSGLYGERFSKVTKIEALGPNTVTVALSKANMMFPALLDVPVIKSGEINVKNPVGSGPYMFDKQDGGYVLKAYENWRNSASLPVQKIFLQEYKPEGILSAFEGRYLDLVFTDPLDVASVNIKGSNDTNYFDTTSMQYVAFNVNGAAFSNPEVRRAMSYLINRDYISGNLMSYAASPAYLPTLLMKEELANIKNEYAYSPDTARQILGANGISDRNGDGLLENPAGSQFAVKFIVSKDNPYKLAAARNISEALVKLGASVDFRQLSWEEYLNALKNGDFDMYYAEVKLTADFDLSALLAGGALNFGGIKDGAYGLLMDAYLAADDNSRKAAAQALYSDIAKTAPIVPVVFRRQGVVAKRGVVSGAEPSQSNVFYNIEKWKITLN